MVGHLLLRGMIVGLIAALLTFGFAKVYGEPPLDQAIGFEAQMDAARDTAASGAGAGTGAAPPHAQGGTEPEIFSRVTQSGLGLFTGLMIYGAAFGGLFALVFAFAYGRIGAAGPRGTAAMVALLGFVAVILVPGLKYPANPPSIGDPGTIVLRTQLYFGMIVLSVAGMVAAVWLAKRLRAQTGGWNAAIVAGAALLAGLTVVTSLMPGINEVPDGFSASVLWRFRMAAWGLQAILWAGIGLGFGAVAERYLGAQGRSRAAGRVATNRA